MAALTREALRDTVLRAEIMALLHDVGKLSWPFVGTGCGQFDYDALLQQHGVPRKASLLEIHTSEFLKRNFADDNDLGALQKRLKETSDGCLPGVPDEPSALGSLLAAHHSGHDPLRSDKNKPLSQLILLTMYADTADSLYSKGAETEGRLRQDSDIFLTTPFGNVQNRIDRKMIEDDARGLHKALAEELAGWRDWRGGQLIEKRRKIRAILKRYGSRHLAETRLPNNDVSLWQHSASVAGIFKALLAGRLLSGNWDGLLRNDELAHCNQRLAFLAFRWDADAYMARSLRSFEVAGRQKKLEELSDCLRDMLETEYCLGNEIYRDRLGICFLTPVPEALPDDSPLKDWPQELAARMESLCNGGIIRGELPWSLHIQPRGLLLGEFLSFWNEPGSALYSGPCMPCWQQEWAGRKGRQPQVCPRCGMHAVLEDPGRIGSGDDIACEDCGKIATLGHRELERCGAALPEGRKENFLRFVRADDEAGDANGENGNEYSEARVALIQGIFSLQALHGRGEPGWAHMLTPDLKAKQDGELRNLRDVADSWRKVLQLSDSGENKKLCNKFVSLLGMRAGSFQSEEGISKEGWCGDAVLTLGLKARLTDGVRRLVFQGESLPEDAEQAAAAMLLWGARQHPSPSRLARVWEELGAFTAWASGLKQAGREDCGRQTEPEESDWLRLPLTRDVTSFQLIVPARDAWRVLHDIHAAYVRRFGRVRHILPLHLSAGIFRRKAPLYIAMDAARRFRALAENSGPRFWELLGSARGQETTRLEWRTHDGRKVVWDVPHLLPNRKKDGSGREDLFRTWYLAEGAALPTHLSRLVPGTRYHVWPSSFDFEVLDASVRRYDIRYRGGPRFWELLGSARGQETTRLEWRTHDGRKVVWDVPHLLPNRKKDGSGREDLFRTWYLAEGAALPTHLSRLVPGTRYHVWPSSFDFEVLDASVRRYDIRYRDGHRDHYMMRAPGPRPYPLEIVRDWDAYLNDSGLFRGGDEGRRQRKNAVELLARLHLEWGWGDPRDERSAAALMARDILRVTMTEQAETLSAAAADGSFFDLCEWADFITK